MKFTNFLFVFFINFFQNFYYSNAILFKKTNDDLIIKFAEDYYKKLENQNLVENMKTIINKKFYRKIYQKKEKIENFSEFFQNSKANSNSTKVKISNKTRKIQSRIKSDHDEHEEDKHVKNISGEVQDNNNSNNINTLLNVNYGDFHAKNRVVKFYITLTQECNVLVNDTVEYEQFTKNINVIEHLVLHNNVDFIDPKGVFSDDVNISFFAYNKKINMFSVYYDNPKEKSNYTFEYDYLAVNLIKSFNNNSPDKLDKDPLNKITSNSTTVANINATAYNSFIWKFFNENLLKISQKITVEFYFSIDKLFEKENVTFSVGNFTKGIVLENAQRIVKYTATFDVPHEEVLVLDVKFPMYFENCGGYNMNVPMIIVGAVFIIFLILVLYLILSSMIFEEY